MRKFLWLLLFLASSKLSIAQSRNFETGDSLGRQIIAYFETKQFQKVSDKRDTIYLYGYNAITFEADWNELIGTYGNLESVRPIFYSNYDGSHFISYKLKFESLPYILNLGINPLGKIVMINFLPAHKVYVSPDYVDVSKYTERNLKIYNGIFELPGIFTSPNSEGKHPLVIILPESGPTDRDGSFGENKPYKDLAGAMASNGYCTFRYDKRSINFGTVLLSAKAAYESYTCKEEYLDDLYKIMDTLLTFSEVDPNRIYLLGHGEGGMLLPLIAKERKEVKAIAMLGTNHKRMQEMMMDQYDYLAKVNPSRASEFMDQKEKALFSMNKKLNPLTEHHKMPYDVQATYWIWLNNYPHVEIAKKLKIRILLMHGDRDYQVNMENLAGWKKDLGKLQNVTIKNYPKLNHLFYSGGAESTYSEYFMIGNIPDYMINDLIAWLSVN